MGFAFFKTPRHHVFEYKPRFYDEEKERREQRRHELGLDAADEAEADNTPGHMIRSGAMRARHESFSARMQSGRRKSQLVLVLLIVGLSVVGYLLMREFMDEYAHLIFKK